VEYLVLRPLVCHNCLLYESQTCAKVGYHKYD